MTAGARPESGDLPDTNPFDTSRPVQQSVCELETLQVVQDHIGTGGSTPMTFRISPPQKVAVMAAATVAHLNDPRPHVVRSGAEVMARVATHVG
jgi:hypothetical protein